MFTVEITNYINQKNDCSKNFDVLDYWEKNARTFPKLYAVFSYLGCAPATSADSGRAFSLANNIIKPTRTNLSSSKVNQMFILNSRLKINNYNF